MLLHSHSAVYIIASDMLDIFTERIKRQRLEHQLIFKVLSVVHVHVSHNARGSVNGSSGEQPQPRLIIHRNQVQQVGRKGSSICIRHMAVQQRLLSQSQRRFMSSAHRKAPPGLSNTSTACTRRRTGAMMACTPCVHAMY